MFKLIIELFKFIRTDKKIKLIFLFFLTIFASLAEIVSLGSLLPFVSFISNPEKTNEIEILNTILNYFEISGYESTVKFLAYLFILAAIVAGLARIFLLKLSIDLSRLIGTELSSDIFRKILTQNYLKHISVHSGEMISGLTQKVSQASGILVSVITLLTSAVIFVSILITLIIIDPIISLLSALTFTSIYLTIGLISRKKLIGNSKFISNEQDNVVKILQESLGSIRDIILSRTYNVYFSIYNKSIFTLNNAVSQNAFVNQSPRFFMETVGMVLISGIIIAYTREDFNLTNIIPILAVLALGAQRLLPLLQMIYGNLTVILGSTAGLEDVLKLLRKKEKTNFNIQKNKSFKFYKSITIKNIFFRYKKNSQYVLKNIDLKIKSGSRVGIIGETGSGKSTLLDVIAGLIKVDKGKIYIDDVKLDHKNLKYWYNKISYVPQNIFLLDTSIKQNIALGVNKKEIDIERINFALKVAQLDKLISKHKKGYDLVVGEKGVRLSGGQRQRIGLARAIYRKSSIILFDEATAALDNETEKEVIESINNISKDITTIMIAHRISSLRYCDEIIKLKEGKIDGIYKYEDIKKL
jgi:ATP-binding cassette, subfamily B, bacterial PglK